MALIRWSPDWDPFQDIDEMFQRMPAVRGNSQLSKGFAPAMDVYETKDAVVAETPLAGVDPKDVEITVDNGLLTVQGQSKKEHEVEEKNYYRKEVRSGSFFRQVPLPVAVLEEKVTAEFEDGVLKINCPKAGESKAKKIEVQIKKKKK